MSVRFWKFIWVGLPKALETNSTGYWKNEKLKHFEKKLYEHPAILEAGVVSAPDPNIGETIKAFVVLKPEYKDGGITEREIIDWAKERLAGYKYPRQIEFLNILLRTSVGKIFRRKLREKNVEENKI